MIRTSLLAFAVVCGCATIAQAVTTIAVGDHSLFRETPNQVISILISDDGQPPYALSNPPGQIRGIDLYLIVDDGTQGPIMTDVNIIGVGTIFNSNNIGQLDFGPSFLPPTRIVAAITLTQSGFVNANGILGFVTLDTTGIPVGDYNLSLTVPDWAPSDIADVDVLPILMDGVLHVVPEPASIVMGLMGAVALGAVVIRKRRK